MSYRKGRAREFYVLKKLREVFPEAYRVPLSGGWKGMDGDIRIGDMRIEVKGWRIYPKLRDELLQKFDALVYKQKHRYVIRRRDGVEMSLKDFVRRFKGKPKEGIRWLSGGKKTTQ